MTTFLSIFFFQQALYGCYEPVYVSPPRRSLRISKSWLLISASRSCFSIILLSCRVILSSIISDDTPGMGSSRAGYMGSSITESSRLRLAANSG